MLRETKFESVHGFFIVKMSKGGGIAPSVETVPASPIIIIAYGASYAILTS